MSDLDDRIAIQQKMVAAQAMGRDAANLNAQIAANYAAPQTLLSTCSTRIAAGGQTSDNALLASIGTQLNVPPIVITAPTTDPNKKQTDR